MLNKPTNITTATTVTTSAPKKTDWFKGSKLLENQGKETTQLVAERKK